MNEMRVDSVTVAKHADLCYTRESQEKEIDFCIIFKICFDDELLGLQDFFFWQETRDSNANQIAWMGTVDRMSGCVKNGDDELNKEEVTDY